MARETLFFANDEATGASAVADVGGRLLHVFTPRVFVADLPTDVRPAQLASVSTVAPADLDDLSRMAAEAWQQQTLRRSVRSALLPHTGDGPGSALARAVGERSTGTPTSLYLTGKVAVGIVMVSGGQWTQMPGALRWVSAAADGTVWGVNSGGDVFRWKDSDWAKMPGALRQISVGDTNKVWGLNSGGDVFQWNGSDWTKRPGALTNVSAASDGSVWGVNSNGDVFYWGGSDWTKAPGALVQVSVGSAKSVWGVNAGGNVFRWNGSDWTKIPGGLSNVSAAADGSVFGVNPAGNIFRYIESANTWQPMPGGFSVISAGSTANIWGVNSSGMVYRGDTSAGLAFGTGEFTDILFETQNALVFLAAAEPLAAVTFTYDLQRHTVSVTPGPDPSISDPDEAMEAPWRNAALVAMGYPGSEAGSVAYVNAIKAQKGTDWAYVGYITKYPLNQVAYQKAERALVHYGKDNLKEVFTRLTCNAFGAADEFGSCGCGGSGYFNIANGNCVNCTKSQGDCIMNEDTMDLCGYTRGQLGWSSWNRMPGQLVWVSTGQDGAVWGVNSGHDVFQWKGSDWAKMPGALRRISVGDANKVWGLNTGGDVFQWNVSDWVKRPGALTNVSAASDGSVWGVDSNGDVFRWGGSDWTKAPGALVQVSAGSAKTVWGVNAGGDVFQWGDGDWIKRPGALTNVSAAADGTVWGVNSSAEIFRWTGTDWQSVPGGALKEVSVGSAKNIWGVNVGGDVFQRQVLATP